MKTRIRKVRKEKGVSQTTLARVLGKAPSTLWKYEHDVIPITGADLFKIAKALKVSIDDLIEDDELTDPAALDVASPTNGQAKDARHA